MRAVRPRIGCVEVLLRSSSGLMKSAVKWPPVCVVVTRNSSMKA